VRDHPFACVTPRGASTLRGNAPRLDGPIRVDREYELFFAFCSNPADLRYLSLVEGLHDRCRHTVCVIGEFWASGVAAHRRGLEALRKFDCTFSNLASSVAAIQDATGRPCHSLPLGIDALLFSPYPTDPSRSIDVYNMGRRHETMHQELLSQSERGEIFYIYDTATDFSVIDPREHRSLLANLIKRSRYFITYPPKFDVVTETGGQQEVGSRFFEGAAGGAVMLGMAPSCPTFDCLFDWPDAVIPTAANGEEIEALIAGLESTPGRIARIRRNNVVNSLLRHDWIYRWRQIVECIGLSPSIKSAERQARLECLARAVAGGGIADYPSLRQPFSAAG